MSARVDQFCDGLRDRLNTVEGRIQSVKTNVQALPGQGETAVRDKLSAVQNKLHTQKEQIEETKAKIKAQAQAKVDETKEAITLWKARRETRKLNARADRAENYAADAIDFAMASIDEAEEAILEAAVARIDADAAR
jgi:hypothetical protein